MAPPPTAQKVAPAIVPPRHATRTGVTHAPEFPSAPHAAPKAIVRRSPTPPDASLARSLAKSATLGFGRHAIRAPNRHKEFSSDIRPAAGISYQLPQLLVFQVDRTRRHSRDQSAAVAVHESSAQHEILKPTPRSCKPHRRSPLSLAFREHLLRSKRGIGFDFSLVFVERAHGVVQQVAAQPSNLPHVAERFVNHAGKLRLISPI